MKQPFLPPATCREAGMPGMCHQISKPDMGMTTPGRAFWIVCATVFIDSLGGSISAPVLPFYAKLLHASDLQVGIAFSVFSFAQVIFLPILGKLSDKFGRRRVLVMSLFGSACGAWLQGLAPTFSTLVLARILSGACGAVGSTANVYVSDITHKSVRVEYLGYLMSSNGAAFAFGPGLGGGLSRFGLNAPVVVNGAMCFVAGFVALFYLPESPVFMRHQEEESRLANWQTESGTPLVVSPRTAAKRKLPKAAYGIFAIEFLRGFAFSAVFALFGLFAMEVYGLDSLHVGFSVCVGALTLIGTNIIIMARLEHLAGHVYSACIGCMLMAVGQVTLSSSPWIWLCLLGLWTVYAGQGIAGANIAGITSIFANDENRGELMSIQQMAQAMGRVVGPLVLGRLSEVSPRLPFFLSASSVLVATAIIWGLKRSYRRAIEGKDIPTPADGLKKSVCETYSKEDVEDLGTFLCELLSEGQYKWHQPDQREELKERLRFLFPPLTGVNNTVDTPCGHLHDTAPGIHSMNLAEVTWTGDDSNFLKSPAGEMRKVFIKRGHSRSAIL